MIITRSWLNEWIDLEGVTTDELAKTLNAIGLEVDRIERYRMPEKIVVGKVLSCEKHPDADKLNVCQVDVGGDVRQIVCGAANVAADMYVPVAVVGAVMPGGMAIKPVKLRGVDSAGMICSSTELGLPKLGEGILPLDESIGTLETGKALTEYPLLNDDLIEIELTANRGDCLSIRGVARDLCAAFNRSLKTFEYDASDENRVGIGKLLRLEVEGEIGVNVDYHAVEIESFSVSLLMQLRLAQIDEVRSNPVEAWLEYVTHSTGVILRAYPVDFFEQVGAEKAQILLKKDTKGFACVYGRTLASVIGIRQEEDSRVCTEAGKIVIEASYIPPEVISQQMAEHKIESGPLYYRTSRGSEPQLCLGVDFLMKMFEEAGCCTMYGGKLEHTDEYEPRIVRLDMEYITQIIGTQIDKGRIAKIFQNLGFDISKSSEQHFLVSVPRFRHDIVNRQDLIEEIVRIVGIDNIPSKPFVFAEADRLEPDYFAYKKRQTYRYRAAQSGFFESVHFVFNERARLEELGFKCLDEALELLNPIAGTLDTLRPTLLAGLLEAASMNAKNGRKRVPLFEIGSVFDTQRRESVKMAMLFAGHREADGIDNAGKPALIDFPAFSSLCADILGDMTLKPAQPSHKLAHPYQSASVWQDGRKIGEIFRLHPTLEAQMDLPQTLMGEFDFEALAYGQVEAKPYSKYQASFRDLSLVMPEDVSYEKVAAVIGKHRSPEIIRFYPVDRYQDEKMGDQMSLTLRFVLQSPEKTLEEEEITGAMQGVQDALESELGATLR